MFQYKRIHLNTGYTDLYDTEDENVIYDIERNIADFTNLKTSDDTVFAYINNDYASIFYKERDSFIYSVLDTDHLLAPELANVYPSDILFNERDLIVNNEETKLMPRRLFPLRYVPFNFMPEELKFVPYILDTLTQNTKKIAILHNDKRRIKDYINFILHLLPVNFAKKVGFITNIDYVPTDLFDSVNERVRIYGLTKEEDDCTGADIIINLNKPYDLNPELTAYGEYLKFAQPNTRSIMQFNNELLKFYGSDGKLNKELFENNLPILLFNQDQSVKNTIELIKLYDRTNNKNISTEQFNKITNKVLSENIYNEDLAKKIDNIINNNPSLESFRIYYRERYILDLAHKYKTLDKEKLDEIVEFFSSDLISLNEDFIANLVKEKNKNSFYILYNIFKKSNSVEKQKPLLDFLAVDRTWNEVVNNKPFEEFIYNEIKDSPDFIDQASLLLYSCCTPNNNTKGYSSNRISNFVKYLSKDLSRVKLLEMITSIYDGIYNYLVKLDKSLIMEFDLLPKNMIMNLIGLVNGQEQASYFDLVDLINNGKTKAYPTLNSCIIDLIKGKDLKGVEYYKKFVNIYNVDKFINFYDAIDEDLSKDVATFLASVKEEGTTSKELEEYRVNFIYQTYLSLSPKNKKDIQDALAIRKNDNPEKALCDMLYNKAKVPEGAIKQKDAIDAISKYSKNETDIIVANGIEGKISHSFSIALLGLLTSFVALVIFNIPAILKSILLSFDITDTFFKINTIVMPIALLYSYLTFIICYYKNIKLSRNNIAQAIGKTFLNYLFLVIIPFIAYAVGYIIVYMTM